MKIIVTKGDALIGSIHTLAQTKCLSICIPKSMKELILYVKSTFADNTRKKPLTQIRVIFDRSNQILENITNLTKLEGGIDVINKMLSRSNADINVLLKREAKLKSRTCKISDVGPNIAKVQACYQIISHNDKDNSKCN